MIKANFNSYNAYVTDSLYQWDKDRILSINGLNLDVAPEIHFTNISMQRAVARQSVLSDGVVTVKIPNSFLQVALTIMAYIGIWEGDTFRTVEVVEIPVIPRVKPSDYTLTDDDEEVYSFNRLEALVSDLSSKNDANTRKIDIVIGRIDTHDSDIKKLKQNISSLEQADVQIKNDIALLNCELGEKYIKFENGFLLQWGTTTHGKYATVSSDVNLPVAYRDAGYRVSLTPGRNGNLIKEFWVGEASGNNTNRTPTHFNVSSTSDGPTYERDIEWIAIGRWK